MNKYTQYIFALYILGAAYPSWCFQTKKTESLLICTSLSAQNYYAQAFIEPSNVVENTPSFYLEELQDEMQVLKKRLKTGNLNGAQRENFYKRLYDLRLHKKTLIQSSSPEMVAELIKQPIVPYRDAHMCQKK